MDGEKQCYIDRQAFFDSKLKIVSGFTFSHYVKRPSKRSNRDTYY